jgi:hypothetical protein
MAKYKTLLDRVRTLFGTQQIRSGAVQLPERMRLNQLEDPHWRDEQEFKGIEATLLNLGFEGIGVFRSEQIPNMQIAYFVERGRSVVATVYESANSGIWVDYSTPYQDGTAFNYSTAPKGRLHNAPPSHTQAAFPALDAAALYRRFIGDRPTKPLRVVEPAHRVLPVSLRDVAAGGAVGAVIKAAGRETAECCASPTDRLWPDRRASA